MNKASGSLSTDFNKLCIFVHRSAGNIAQPGPGRCSNLLLSADLLWPAFRAARRCYCIQHQGQAKLKPEEKKCCRNTLAKTEKAKYK